ncbi:MAG TPA: hypothetical protein VFV48_07655 [Pseudomonadales bacterium]|nr:hypothetical protein [Pseudomonadales bacterium]
MSLPQEQISVKKSRVIDRTPNLQAANSPGEEVKTKEPQHTASWPMLALAAVIASFSTYLYMQTQIVAPLQDQVMAERSEKVAYMTADKLDFKTLEPRIRELEASNAAKAKKEAILVATIDQLSSELAKFTAPFEDVPAKQSTPSTAP